jgi:thymidylate synthase ThyX
MPFRDQFVIPKRSELWYKLTPDDRKVAAAFNVQAHLQQAIYERSIMSRKISLGVLDHLSPDVAAMVMAKYSRDIGFIEDRIPDSAESAEAHRNALRKFYVGYGHGSIGDMMDTDAFLENISMLAAEEVVDEPLFRGQYTSTRYLDFTDQPMVSNHPEITEWQERWRTFYLKAIPLTQAMLKEQFPFSANQGTYHHKEDSEVQEARKRETWENTIKARAFDICRGLLPAGITTKGCAHGSANFFNQHFGKMLGHPLPELQSIAHEVMRQFAQKYPDAANSIEKQRDRYKYMNENVEYYYSNDVGIAGLVDMSNLTSAHKDRIGKTREMFEEIPGYINSRTRLGYSDLIDYGSYRDLHRHRRGYINLPILTPKYRFHDYYINNIPPAAREELLSLLSSFEEWHRRVPNLTDLELQYATPMGYQVPFTYTCDLNQAMYILELRSGKTVHQTLREVCHQWARELWKIYPQLNLHIDWDVDNFTLKRGTQTLSAP